MRRGRRDRRRMKVFTHGLRNHSGIPESGRGARVWCEEIDTSAVSAYNLQLIVSGRSTTIFARAYGADLMTRTSTPVSVPRETCPGCEQVYGAGGNDTSENLSQ